MKKLFSLLMALCWLTVFGQLKIGQPSTGIIIQKNLCRYFKVDIEKVSTNSNCDRCCYSVSILNKYTGPLSLRPRSFRITVKYASIISESGTPAGWNKTQNSSPPFTDMITWTKTTGYIPNGRTNLSTICFDKIRLDPFYITYEWLDKQGRTICRESVQLSCRKDTIPNSCCRYSLNFSNTESNSLFKTIKITPVGTTRISNAISDDDIWTQNNDANYTYITYTDAQNGQIPLIPVEEENIWFSIDPTSSAAPKIKAEWMNSSGAVIATHILSLPCFPEKDIDDPNIDWDSYTQIISGNQYKIFTGIDQVECSPAMYRTMETCPDITYALSCDGSNHTVLTINRSSTANPLFEWKVNGASYGSVDPLVINSASGNTYNVELLQSVKYENTSIGDSIVVDCTSDKEIKIGHPNPNFATLQIGQPCPDFIIKFIYTDGIFDIFQPSDWTYNWKFELAGVNKGTSTDQNPTMSFADPGTYDVTIEVTTGWGCKYTATKQITLSRQCKADFDWSYTWCADSTIKQDMPYATNVTFTNLSTGGTCPTYEIDFGNGFVPFPNSTITHQFTGIPGATFPVKLKMTDHGTSGPLVCGTATNTIKITPLKVNLTYITCPNGDVALNTTSLNPTWEFPGANNQFTFTLLNKHKSSPKPNYSPGIHIVYLTSYDPGTHAYCRIGKEFKTIDICCDDQRKLSPFTTTINGNNYKMRGKFKVKYKNFQWTLWNKHTNVMAQTIAFKEKTKKNGNKKWRRFKPEAIYAGVEGDFFNTGVNCDCDNLNQYANGDGSWDWWLRSVRFRGKIKDNGVNYTRWQSAKSVHRITVNGQDWTEYIYLGELGCTQ